MNNGNNGHDRNGTGTGLVPTNGHRPDAALDATHQELLWDGLSPAVTQALSQPLDPIWSPSAGAAPDAPSPTSRATPSSTRPTPSSATAAGATNSWET